MSNTRKLPQDKQAPTPASGWKKAGALLTLPSGNVLRVKNPGIMEMAHQGLVPNSLMTMIMSSVSKGNELKAEEIFDADLNIADMFEMMDSAIMLMAVEPEIHPVPVWDEEDVQAERCRRDQIGQPALAKQDPELLYISDVGEEDKMFIWQWATGGTADVEQFRRESSDMLGTLPGRKAVASPTKRAPARKR